MSGNFSRHSVRNLVFLTCAAVLLSAGLAGCFKEEFDMSPSAQLDFSADTLRFDTVFTELGSATRSFRVYNPNDLSIRISRISLEQQGSRYRINVDGFQGPEIRDVEIRPNDSIWVFAEVTIDPDAPLSLSPFVTEDYLVFETNGNVQKVLLEAWGQNANYIPNRFHGNRVSILTCDLGEERWDDEKPYVLYGTLVVDSCTLVLPAGTRVYVHGGIANNQLGIYNDGLLYMLSKARLISEGTLDQPVIIQDDRLEEDFISLWGGIQFGPASGPHHLMYTTIRHTAAAIVADSATQVTLENCILHGTAGPGLFARHANITATNCLIYDNGTAGIALTYGGTHRLDYCTVVNSGNDGEALVLTNFYCPDPLCQEGLFVNALDVRIRNSIFVGSSADEIVLSDAAPAEMLFDVDMQHCIVQVADLLDPDQYPDFFMAMCTDCITYRFGDTLFVDEGEYDYHLDTLSIAEEKALAITGISFDLEDRLRDPILPDIGCYEYYPE